MPVGAMLLCMVGIFYLAYRVSRYLAGRGASPLPGMKGRHMRVLDRMMLSQDKMIVLVQIGTQYLVLGVSSGQISLLSELEPEQAQLWLEEPPQAPKGQSFSEALGHALRTMGKKR